MRETLRYTALLAIRGGSPSYIQKKVGAACPHSGRGLLSRLPLAPRAGSRRDHSRAQGLRVPSTCPFLPLMLRAFIVLDLHCLVWLPLVSHMWL